MNTLSNLTEKQAQLLTEFMNGRTFSCFSAAYGTGSLFQFNDNGEEINASLYWQLETAIEKLEIDFDLTQVRYRRTHLTYEEAKQQGKLHANLEL